MTGKTREAASSPSRTAGAGRLEGKIVLITGAAGNLGSEMARRFAHEGATLILTGRTRDRIEAACADVVAQTGVAAERVAPLVLDGGDPASVRAAMDEVKAKFGRIDVLVNNAGSPGPKQPLDNVPLSKAEMEANGDAETVGDAMRNILAVTWNLARAAADLMQPGAAIINISTIFSHTRYYGRIAYVVPKAALNALSRQLASEFGARGVRVNTVFPGPIESERIRTVFAAMDKVQGNKDGETAEYFMGRMSLRRSVDGAPPARTLPTPADIAQTCLFLASEESAALNGAEIDVAHGMSVRKESRSTYKTRPSLRALDGAGLTVLIVAGESWDDALETARIQIGCGARVLLGMAREADVAQARARTQAQGLVEGLTIVRFNRTEPDKMAETLEAYSAEHGPVTSAIVLPVKPAQYFAGALLDAEDAIVDEFMDVELVGGIAIARTLSRYWKTRDDLQQAPRYVFMTNASDGAGDVYSQVLAAAMTQLVRIWRDEARVDVEAGRFAHVVWGNQIVRFSNRERENIRFAAGHATRIVFKEQRIANIDLHVPEKIGEETGATSAMVGFAENITGLHLGKVALITGGSAGIGGQVARLLALAGAKVMMVARRGSELEAARDRIIGELQDIGFSGVERRVRIMADVDVSNFASLKTALDATIEAWGRVDYLINNAGVAGAEDMVVDMDLDAWRFTLDANLISNYYLTHHAAPLMKKQGSGYVLNVSSYFGGEKLRAVAYPNRADYAVSKAGQRAMVESFSQFLGPIIQLNAIAPGPVDGDRLSGVGGKPGLFQRRARLILENKRLNSVYAEVIKSVREGASVATVLNRLSHNTAGVLSHDMLAPAGLRKLALKIAREGDGVCTWDQYILTPALAARLLSRLRLGGYLLDEPAWRDLPEDKAKGGWLRITPPDDAPFLPQGLINKNAEQIGEGVLSQLHLGKMPTEADVAQATVFYLADRAVSGETFMPSGGLNVERSTVERDMFGGPRPERVEKLRGKTVWFVGDHLADYIAAASQRLIDECGVAGVVVLARTKAGGKAVTDMMQGDAAASVHVVVSGDDIEGAMDKALAKWGRPATVVSLPGDALPDRLFEDDAPLTPEAFSEVVEDNLTRHFRVSRKASLYDGCQLILVSPDVAVGANAPAHAIANFIKTTLHAFTATLAVENERLVHNVPTNQINLTRRVRSEEPRNEEEHQEELRRFATAILLVGAPLPDSQDSRYRSRIYRGTSMTV
jgi:malonyl-CoA reductase/3-hydroxypropionate dehydrogenase (NADP+)